MFKDFIKQDIGIELIPLISLCVFVAFFTILLIRVISFKKDYIKEVGNIPLEGNNENETSTEKF